MKFILMMHTPHGTGDYQHIGWSPDDWRAHLDYWRSLNADLAARGELVGVEALAPPGRARVVRAGRQGASGPRSTPWGSRFSRESVRPLEKGFQPAP